MFSRLWRKLWLDYMTPWLPSILKLVGIFQRLKRFSSIWLQNLRRESPCLQVESRGLFWGYSFWLVYIRNDSCPSSCWTGRHHLLCQRFLRLFSSQPWCYWHRWKAQASFRSSHRQILRHALLYIIVSDLSFFSWGIKFCAYQIVKGVGSKYCSFTFESSRQPTWSITWSIKTFQLEKFRPRLHISVNTVAAVMIQIAYCNCKHIQ